MLDFFHNGDITLLTKINQEWISPWLDPLMEMFSSVPMLAVVILLAIALVRRRRKSSPRVFLRKYGWRNMLISCLLLACSVMVTEGATNTIKYYSNRQRPYHVLAGTRYPDDGRWVRRPADAPVRNKRGSSFVSGHASNSMALAVTLRSVFPPLQPFIYALPLCVGYSRVYLGRHYPSDVAAGWFLGWLLSSGVCHVFRGRIVRPRAVSARNAARPAGVFPRIQPENIVI